MRFSKLCAVFAVAGHLLISFGSESPEIPKFDFSCVLKKSNALPEQLAFR